ncbi:hypothetical protein D9M70_489080 [compost metagenome]
MARTNGTISADEAEYVAGVRRTTLSFGFLYQFLQFVISSALWAILGYDPIKIAPITLILMLNGTLMSYAMAAILFHFRERSILFKLLLGSALSLVAAAINAGVDFLCHGLIEHGDPGDINRTNVGYTIIYCMPRMGVSLHRASRQFRVARARAPPRRDAGGGTGGADAGAALPGQSAFPVQHLEFDYRSDRRGGFDGGRAHGAFAFFFPAHHARTRPDAGRLSGRRTGAAARLSEHRGRALLRPYAGQTRHRTRA